MKRLRICFSHIRVLNRFGSIFMDSLVSGLSNKLTMREASLFANMAVDAYEYILEEDICSRGYLSSEEEITYTSHSGRKYVLKRYWNNLYSFEFPKSSSIRSYLLKHNDKQSEEIVEEILRKK